MTGATATSGVSTFSGSARGKSLRAWPTSRGKGGHDQTTDYQTPPLETVRYSQPPAREVKAMYAVIGKVKLRPGREQEALAMLNEHGAAMLGGMTGSAGGYWARS